MSESSMVQFKLNMPAALRERLGDAADRSGRSLTAEVIARLEKSFEADDEFTNALDNIDDLMARVEKLEAVVRDLEYISTGRDPYNIEK